MRKNGTLHPALDHGVDNDEAVNSPFNLWSPLSEGNGIELERVGVGPRAASGSKFEGADSDIASSSPV